MSDSEVAAMTSADKAQAFIEGRYAKSTSTGGMGDMTGTPSENMPTDGETAPTGEAPSGNAPTGEMPTGEAPTGTDGQTGPTADSSTEEVGTPDQGTTQSANSGTDSSNYATYEEMLAAYESDIESIEAGDTYGNNIVDLYDPLQYIGDDDVDSPTWTRIMMGASEGDMSMFSSLNLEIAWLNSGTDSEIEWQWDGGHVPSEILGESFSLYVDEMYGKYVDGAAEITKSEAETQTVNGTASEATGTDISDWVSYDNGTVSFSLADAAAYRVSGAAKAIPGFDVMDYGQETYEFGSSSSDARHFDKYVLEVLKEHEDTLSSLFNAG